MLPTVSLISFPAPDDDVIMTPYTIHGGRVGCWQFVVVAGGCYGGVDCSGGGICGCFCIGLLNHFGSVSGSLEPEEIQREQ